MYDHFASVYDKLMDQVPYASWCEHLIKILRDNGIDDGLVLDLGCGTAQATMLLSRAGYDMIGVDGSEEMLMEARAKMSEEERSRILLLNQDMREFELYGTVRAVISMCDTLNYCENEEDLLQVFRLVNNYLDPGGLFLFDLNTVHKYRDILGDNVFALSGDDCAYIWENSWFEDEQVNEYDLTLFIGEEGENVFTRHRELHVQRAFSDETVRSLLSRAGLKLEQVTQAYTGKPLSDQSERVLYVAREQVKGKTPESV